MKFKIYKSSIILVFILCSCRDKIRNSSDDVVGGQEKVKQQKSSDFNLLIVDKTQDISKTYHISSYANKNQQDNEKNHLERFIASEILIQESQKYSFKLLGMIFPGKVYDLVTKKIVSEGCFHILYDEPSGFIFSYPSFDLQYKHFKSTELSIESPFSGTWCVDGDGFLTEFISNSKLSIPGESVSYFVDSYLFARGFLADNELLKRLFSTAINSGEISDEQSSQGAQLTAKPIPAFKGDPSINQALKNLYSVNNRRIATAKPYIPPAKDLESVETIFGTTVDFDLRKGGLREGFHVVTNGKRNVVLQGGPTCNPSACINALTFLEPSKLRTKAIEKLYYDLINYDYKKIREINGATNDGRKIKKTVFSYSKESGFTTPKVSGALNRITAGDKILGKYRFEPRKLEGSSFSTNTQKAKALIQEFKNNDRKPMVVAVNLYPNGRNSPGSGHALTLENIRELDGDIWMDLFDSNGRNFSVKAGSEMRMESLSEIRSTGKEIRIQSSLELEFDLKNNYILIKEK
ncbi:MAG: hypothetical protein AB8G05_16630 [Oligoflexales bacterium]